MGQLQRVVGGILLVIGAVWLIQGASALFGGAGSGSPIGSIAGFVVTALGALLLITGDTV